MTEKLYLQERLDQILNLIEEKTRASVQELSERFAVSPVTIRSDLANLERKGLLLRTHGGAMAKPAAGVVPAFTSRQQVRVHEKERIGRAAAQLVRDGEAIVLDDSTTCWYIAQHLKDRQELTVVTNGLYLALEFLESPGVTVVMPGGTLRAVSASLVGENDIHILERYYLQKGFFSARGLTLDEGLTDPDHYGAEIKRRLLERSKTVIAVVDSSKWNQVSFATFARLGQLDHVITGSSAPPDLLQHLRARGVQIELV